MDPTNLMLVTLLLGGLMGLLGQGARAVVGLKGMVDEANAQNLSASDLFQAARLLTSLFIGFLAGLAAALISMRSGIVAPTWDALLGFAAAGYLGTDFLEGFISKYLTPDVVQKARTNLSNQLVELASSQDALVGALEKHSTLLEDYSSSITKAIPTKDQIKAGIADAMSDATHTVNPADLGDDDTIPISGGANILIDFLRKLNHEFWSDNILHITPDDFRQNNKVGKLVTLILKRLGGH